MKYYTVATRDFSKTIRMGALIARTGSGTETTIAPPETRVFHEKAGTIARRIRARCWSVTRRATPPKDEPAEPLLDYDLMAKCGDL